MLSGALPRSTQSMSASSTSCAASLAAGGGATMLALNRLPKALGPAPREQWPMPGTRNRRKNCCVRFCASEELAAKRLERAQVGIVRVEDRREQLVDRGHVEVVVVGRPEPRRAEHPLEERAERRLGAGLLRVPAELRGVLAAAHPARVDEVAATRVARTVVACTC